jgi:DNA-binding NarL/FixJ family response regulator
MNVLITDDSAAVRKILRRVIQQTELPLGNIYEAADGLEALRCLRFNTVNLILSDIKSSRIFSDKRRVRRAVPSAPTPPFTFDLVIVHCQNLCSTLLKRKSMWNLVEALSQ